MSAVSEPMSPRQRAAWAVILGVCIILIVIRCFIGEGMGKVYVEPTDLRFGELSADTWKSMDQSEFETFVASNPDAATEQWTKYDSVPPSAYFEQQQQGGGGSIFLSWPRTLGLWLAAFFTLAIYSFLYRDNPFYKFAESVVVGVSAAYAMVVGFWDTIVPNLIQRLLPQFAHDHLTPGMTLPTDAAQFNNLIFLLPLALGIMLLCRLVPKGAWMSLWPLAFIVGTMAGLRIVGYTEGDLLSQVRDTISSLYVPGADTSTPFMAVWTTIWSSVAACLLVIGVLCCLVYFFFSVEHKGAVGGVARVGIWYLMITFGAAFGFTVMGRIALLAARFEFLFDDWLWLIDPNQKRVVAETVSMLMCL